MQLDLVQLTRSVAATKAISTRYSGSASSAFTQALLGAHLSGNHASQTSFRAGKLEKSVA